MADNLSVRSSSQREALLAITHAPVKPQFPASGTKLQRKTAPPAEVLLRSYNHMQCIYLYVIGGSAVQSE